MLIVAARNGRADFVRLLLDAGADKEAKTKVRDRSAVSAFSRAIGIVMAIFIYFNLVLQGKFMFCTLF